MSELKNENHIVIHGWMINELNLKGNELIIYAFIYGVSQDGESEFYGSRSYLANCCNASLPTVDNALSSLVEKEFIIKRQENINGVIFNRYKISYDILKTLGVVKNLYRGSKETLHNNKYNNKEELNNNKLLFNKKKENKFSKPTLEEVQSYCTERNNNIDAQYFIDYYESNGWRVGKNPMKDWKAAVRTWERNDKTNNNSTNKDNWHYELIDGINTLIWD